MTITKLQEYINRVSMAESLTLEGEALEEYREIIKDAMRYRFLEQIYSLIIKVK
jgi:hypothetical protein